MIYLPRSLEGRRSLAKLPKKAPCLQANSSHLNPKTKRREIPVCLCYPLLVPKRIWGFGVLGLRVSGLGCRVLAFSAFTMGWKCVKGAGLRELGGFKTTACQRAAIIAPPGWALRTGLIESACWELHPVDCR